MLRIGLTVTMLLSLSSLTACDPDGKFCLGDCDGFDGSDEPPPPAPQPDSVSVTVDGLERASVAVARGGVAHVEVYGRRIELPTIVEESPVFGIIVTSQTTQAPSLTKLDVIAEEVGVGALRASVTGFSAVLEVRVAELASVGLSVGETAPRDQLTVMPDIAFATLHLRSGTGESLLDHSIAIDPGSEPDFSLEGRDEIALPTTPGDHVLVLVRATGERYPVDVRVVEHVDDIVVDQFDAGQATGNLCVHGVFEGERVETRDWRFTASPGLAIMPTNVGCIGFSGATVGSTVTVERAGTTKELVIL